MLTQYTLERLTTMRLKGMVKAYLEQTKQPETAALSFEERFSLIVDHEYTYRENRRLERLLREAKLRMTACVEDIHYHTPRGLDRSLMQSLGTCEWIRLQQNVLISGATGVGKTFIACALGNAACRQGLSTRYYRVPRLLTDLTVAKADGSYGKCLTRLAKTNLLILDDWGLARLTPAESREILEVIEDRTNQNSTIVSSQLPIESWHDVLGEPTVADAILDRVMSKSHRILLHGESLRRPAEAPEAKEEPGEDRQEAPRQTP